MKNSNFLRIRISCSPALCIIGDFMMSRGIGASACNCLDCDAGQRSKGLVGCWEAIAREESVAAMCSLICGHLAVHMPIPYQLQSVKY